MEITTLTGSGPTKVIYLTLIWLFQIWSGDHHLLIKGKTYESIADEASLPTKVFFFISTMHVIWTDIIQWLLLRCLCWHLLKRSVGTLFWRPLHWAKAWREKLLEYLYHRDNKVSDENERGSVHIYLHALDKSVISESSICTDNAENQKSILKCLTHQFSSAASCSSSSCSRWRRGSRWCGWSRTWPPCAGKPLLHRPTQLIYIDDSILSTYNYKRKSRPPCAGKPSAWIHEWRNRW